MSSKNIIALEQKQALRLIPLQKQMGELLELNPQEIEERIERELDDNPALELKQDDDMPDELNKTDDGEEFDETEQSISDYGNDEDDNDSRYYNQNINSSADDDYYESPVIAEQSLNEYLMEQLHERETLSPVHEVIAQYIIGDLDDNGYLTRTVSAIASDVTFSGGVEVDDAQVEEVLEMVRELDPAGIAATSVQDCLLLQLERQVGNDINRLAYEIIRDNFEDYRTRHFDKLASKYKVSRDTINDVIAVISSLNGKPAANFSGSISEHKQLQISPDFYVDVDQENQVLTLSLLNKVSELQISQSFRIENERLIKSQGEKLTKRNNAQATFIKTKFNSAQDFINVLRMRQETLFRTMKAIMEHQKDYFLTGDPAAIHPLRLQDIADEIKMDVSVVSRATSNKYVECVWGIKPLKYFFNESLLTSSGKSVSSREVMEALKQIVDAEDKTSPLSDDQILEELNKRGYNIKRRTVAKYRVSMNIPHSRYRKI